MDLWYNHHSLINVIAVYDNADLVAIAGDNCLQVLHVTSNACNLVANFQVGTRLTALAFSPRTSAPADTDDWCIEIAAATQDYRLHLYSKTPTQSENIFSFGGGISGHHGTVTGMTFCGGLNDDASRYLASVSDDKILMVWDLYPSSVSESADSSRSSSLSLDDDERPQPIAYPIHFANPLASVASHPSTTKELLVGDTRGSIFRMDWKSDPDASMGGPDRAWRHPSIIELVETKSLADALLGGAAPWSGTCSIAWKKDDPEIIGATHNNRFSIWDLRHMQGGKPLMTGTGSGSFRWCDSDPGFFALASNSPLTGALISMRNISYVHAEPSVLLVAPRPRYIRDFNFLSSSGPARVAAAVGHELIIFSLGDPAANLS
ncbi:WD40-repeat-containing domain protein [Pterulicium gracile]|uniref:WD40-repeat-containing domain protein n=1 Tax=Pterulicium gracile TaxID=1884261 RepID=A0A5C3QUW4_9AGAR|nr:WD40-repeat-containing domain protein [Pterula gracilis]